MAIIEGFDRLGVGLDMSSFSGGLTFFSTEGVLEPLLLDFNFFLDGTFDATYQSPGALAEFFVIFGEVFSDGLLVTDVFYFDEFINSVLNLGFIDVFISNEDLFSGGTDWFLFALLGDDLLIGNNFGDVLKGGERDDTLFGEGGDDHLFGESGDDDLHGGFGDDTLSGGQGDDRLEGGIGVNRLEGGTGTDSAVFAGSFAAYSITLAPGGVTLSRNGETTTAVSVETFLFEDRTLSLADVLAAIPATPPVTPPSVEPPVTPPPVAPPTTPSAPSPTGPTQGDDAMSGTGGPDRMSALSGDDTMRGLGGDDTLLGQGGNDALRGGGGNDSLKGGAGADRLFGQVGNDTLKGGAGADFLNGGSGADRLIGGGGADTVDGGKGADTMIGGAGADLFRFKPGDGNDVIQRFQQGVDLVEFKRGVSGFEDLTVAQQGADVLVSYARGSILFTNQNAAAFGEEDFLF